MSWASTSGSSPVDVQLHLLGGELLEPRAHPLGLGTLTTDDDARSGCPDVDPDPVAGPLDLDLRDPGTPSSRVMSRRIFTSSAT